MTRFEKIKEALNNLFCADLVSVHNIQGYSIYCYGGTMEEIKEEIAEAGGVAPSEVILYRFKGWIRTEEYEREAV